MIMTCVIIVTLLTIPTDSTCDKRNHMFEVGFFFRKIMSFEENIFQSYRSEIEKTHFRADTETIFRNVGNEFQIYNYLLQKR